MSHARRALLLWLTFGGLCALVARPARAQNPAAAEALFEQARAAMAAGSYDIACARFRDSDKLDPAVGTRFNLADCEEKRGRVATAWSLFRGVLAELAEDDDRRPIAQARIEALEPRLPYLTMRRDQATPPGVRVRVDGVELGEGSFGVTLPMDPGAHDLALVPAEGGDGQRSTFTLREGERRDIPIRLSEGAEAKPTDHTAGNVGFQPADGSQRKWAYVTGGVGAAAVAFGAVTGIITLSKKSTANANCSDRYEVCNSAGVEANESGRTFGALSTIGLSVGVVGLAAGAYLWLTAPSSPPRAAHPSIPLRPGLRVRPELVCSAGSGFVAVAGSF
ncbi:MAG TPA: hypothetical protein VHP33_20975 [Polyangiaceae bacterium]|nr:hypothetical protein [Polyangiaceae bacterium]